jgi:benzoyl-CoA reductase/2-hydroxyglutaryl-CoA dehydratase subunit BcrC/BadD/HgdB
MDLERLTAAARDPVAELRRRCEASGRPLALALSSYVPVEVLDAAGFEAAWLPPLCRARYPVADGSVQSYVCAVVRSAVEAILGGELPVAIVATASGCDAMTAVPGILSQERASAAAVAVRLPIAVGGESGRTLARSAVKEFADAVSAVAGRPLDSGTLESAIRLRERVRVALSDRFSRLPDPRPSVAYTLARAAQVLAPADFLDALERGGEPDAFDASGKVRVLLSGDQVPSDQAIRDIETLGVIVAADDTETGTRSACRRVGFQAPDRLSAIADSLVDRTLHGPTRVESDLRARVGRIVALARQAEIRAAVFCPFKFCDPHAFEVPELMTALRQAGIPSLLIEVDREEGLGPRDLTRIQTLVEALP